MSNDTQKADQIALHFYTKLFYVVNDARNITETNLNSKIDKWFNLETPDSDLFTREAREPYRSLSSHSSPPPPLEIQVLLTIPELTNNQVLVYQAPDSSRVRVTPTPKFILLESWVLAFTPRDHHDSVDAEEHVHVALPTIYKHGIPLFRSLYSLLRILPAWKLCKRLRRRGIAQINRGNGLGVQVRVRETVNDRILEFDVPPSSSCPPLSTSAHSFPSVPLPMGTLTLTSTYLSTPNFKVDELESLLSSNFMTLDVGPEFTPTLVKNQQRDSLLSTYEGSPGSLPMRTSLPLSPPREIVRPSSRLPSNSSRPTSRLSPEDADTIADRFVLPSPTAQTQQLSSSPPPPTQRIFPITRATTTTSTTTTTPLLSAARLRKESLQRPTSDTHLPIATSTSSHPFPSSSTSIPPLQTGSTTGTGSQTSPISMRRPGLSPVNPFKSGTLVDRTGGNSSSSLGLVGTSGSPSSFSSSLRNQVGATGSSPMSSTGLPSLPNFPRVSGPGSSTSGSGTGSAIVGLPPHSPAPGSSFGSGVGVGAGGSRPSPPFAPSSLGDRSGVGPGSLSSGGGGGGTGGEIPVPTRKRYSSSFGHRYSSVGSTGSGGSVGSGQVGASGEASPSPRTQLRELAPAHSRTSSLGQTSTRSGMVGGSAAIGAKGDGQGSSSFLGTTTDDDDISVFVQDIDARKPLIGRSKSLVKGGREASVPVDSPVDASKDQDNDDSSANRESVTRNEGRERTIREHELGKERGDLPPSFSGPGPRRQSSTISSTGSGSGTTIGAATIRPLSVAEDEHAGPGIAGPLPSSPPTGSGPMLTSETEVDEKLKKMNEAFLASLEGLVGGPSRVVERPVPALNFLGQQSSVPVLSSPVSPSTVQYRGSGRGSTGSPLHNQLQFTTQSDSNGGESGQGSQEVIGRLELGSKRRMSGK